MAWGSFLLLPPFTAGVAEAVAHLHHRWRRAWLPAVVAGIALLAAGWQSWGLYDLSLMRWNCAPQLNLPGAEFLRPPETLRYALRILSANARLHADVLFSRPGMYGFNL